MIEKEITQEEQKLRSMAPAENPFRVPEGYFDQLPDTIMQRIQAQKQPRQSRWHRWAIAAAFVGLVSGVSAVLYTSGKSEEPDAVVTAGSQITQVQQQSGTVNEEALNYAMVDNGEIEYYLTTE